jgi:hypothetical protein
LADRTAAKRNLFEENKPERSPKSRGPPFHAKGENMARLGSIYHGLATSTDA